MPNFTDAARIVDAIEASTLIVPNRQGATLLFTNVVAEITVPRAMANVATRVRFPDAAAPRPRGGLPDQARSARVFAPNRRCACGPARTVGR